MRDGCDHCGYNGYRGDILPFKSNATIAMIIRKPITAAIVMSLLNFTKVLTEFYSTGSSLIVHDKKMTILS